MKFPQILSLAILSLLTACQSAPVEPSSNSSATEPVPSAPTPTPESSLTATPEKVSYSSCNVDGPYLSLTFDDGPNPTLTPKLLDLLKEKGVKATFFIVGENAARYPDVVRRIAAEGHEIGNHTWTHAWLTRIGESAIRVEISKSSALIEQLTGRKPSLIRPPYGAATRSMDRWITQEFGLRVIVWSVDSLDWKHRDSDHVRSVILREAQPGLNGSIILSHDIHTTTVSSFAVRSECFASSTFQVGNG